MALTKKIFAIFALVFFVCVVQTLSKPVEESGGSQEGYEMMEGAESQNPHMPRFAMRRFKERRQQAQAERRSYQGHGHGYYAERRQNQQRPQPQFQNQNNQWPYRGYLN
ncbi:hypothetical protein O0L34_g6039 [Tuta absoluta]|nr:hypothetical protein O0L34_g6039 [Tuta absoluta]